MRKPDWRKHRPLGILALFSMLMVAPLIFAGKVYFFRDFGRFYFPLKKLYVQRLLHGEFPLWVPEMCCGTPAHGEMVHAFLYPLNLFLFLGAWPGWGLYFAAHLLLAGWGGRRLALRFGASPAAALAAGIAFAGSGYLVSQLNHVPYASTAAWAPLIVSLVLDLGARRPFTVPLLAVSFTMAALAGEPFTLLLTVLFAGVLILAGFAGPRLSALLGSAVAGIAAVLLASPSLLPGYLQLGESVRAGGVKPDLMGFGSLHPIRFVALFAPEGLGRMQAALIRPVPFFGSEVDIVPPILLGIHLGALTMVAILLAPILRSRAALVFVATILLAGLLSLGPHLGLATWLARHVPGLGSFRYPDKYWFLATLAAAPLLGITLERLRPRPSTLVAAAGAVTAFVLGMGTRQPGGAVTGAIAFALVALAFRAPREWRTRALTAALALELLFFGLRHNLVTDPENLSPMSPRGIGAALRREMPGRLFLDVDFPRKVLERQVEEITLFQLEHLDPMSGVPDGFSYSIGYDPVEPLGRIPKFFTMPGELTPLEQSRVWHRLLRLSSTTHAITNKELGPDPEVVLLPHLRGAYGVHVLAYVRPEKRARLYGDVEWQPDVEAGRRRVQDLAFDPFRVLVLEGKGKPEARGRPVGTVRFLLDRPHRVRLAVESDRPAWLFLADACAKGWRAWVNGAPEKIEIGLVAFRAVRVPRGRSEVEFRYEPEWLRIVPFSAGAGLLLLAILFLLGRRISASGRGKSRTSSAGGR